MLNYNLIGQTLQSDSPASAINPNFQINYDEKKIVGRGLLNQVRDIAITNIINLVFWVGGILLFVFLVQLVFSKESDKTGVFVKRAIPILSLMVIAFILSTPAFNSFSGYVFREISSLLTNIRF
jgi:hypothetical protein